MSCSCRLMGRLESQFNRSEILALTGGVEVLYDNKGIAF